MVAVVFALLLGVAARHNQASPQFPKTKGGFAEMERQALAEPFQGVTTDGKAVSSLFPIRSTGVSTEPVRKAAEAFLASLDEKQRQATLFPVDDQEWRKWSNIHRYTRQGAGLLNMTDRQRELAFGLLRAGLSAKGLQKTRDVMRLNGTLGELTRRPDEYGEWLYWITVMGKPSATEPWGWQLDGHHAIINYFILRDQVVMTPSFLGSEPIRAESGKFAGTVVMQDEQNKGQALMAALTEAQRRKAILETSKPGNNNLGEAFRDNLVLDYAGIRASELTAPQKLLLLDLIGEYADNLDDGHARVKMEEVRMHLDKTHFAWIGETGPEAVFYYRIQSPVILIEFDHQRPVALEGPRVPGRRHIHTVVRTPNGNDYGKDLLRQHYQRSHRTGS